MHIRSFSDVAGKPREFNPYIGGSPRYVERRNQITASGYESFELSA